MFPSSVHLFQSELISFNLIKKTTANFTSVSFVVFSFRMVCESCWMLLIKFDVYNFLLWNFRRKMFESQFASADSNERHADRRKSAAILNSQKQNSKDQDGELFKFTCIHPAKAKLECSRVQYIYFNRNISFNLIKS